MHNYFSTRRLCALLTAASLTLSLSVSGYAAGAAEADEDADAAYTLLSPQTPDDPQYWAEYRKYNGEAESEPASEAAPMALTADTFQFTSPYTETSYTITGSQEDLALGVDVSYYQEEIDWAAAKADGVEFAFIRAAYRGYSQAGTLVTDTQFYNNLAGACAQDIKVGIYIYSQATTEEEAREEAEYVLALIDGYKLDLPIIFDQEFAEFQGGFMGRLYDAYNAAGDKITFLTDLACAFCDTIDQSGYTSMVYGSTAHFNNRMDVSRLSNPVWVAQYGSTVSLNGAYAFWQYSSAGSVDGIPGYADCDFAVDPAFLDCSNPSDTGSVSRIVITPGSYPTDTISAAPFTLTGSIISALPLASVSAALLDENGAVVQNYTDRTSVMEYIIKGSPIDQNLKFSALTPGSYTLRYTAVDQKGAEKVWTSEPFQVASEDPVPSRITITPGSYPTGNITAKSFTLTGTITSTYPLTTVTAAILRADGSVIQTCTDSVTDTEYTIKGSAIDNGLRFAALSAGYYYLTYTAEDQSGAKETWQSDVFAVADTVLFPDVLDSSKWYYSYAYKAASLGIISGVGTNNGVLFCPNDSLTRAQIVCMLYRVAGSPAVSGNAHPFTDAKVSWYQTALTWAYQEGVVSGTSPTTFSPDSPVTREELATMLYQFSKASPAGSNYLSSYTDAGQVSSWAVTYVNWCLSQGLLSSVSTEELIFSPKSSATRAQASVILSNYIEKLQ